MSLNKIPTRSTKIVASSANTNATIATAEALLNHQGIDELEKQLNAIGVSDHAPSPTATNITSAVSSSPASGVAFLPDSQIGAQLIASSGFSAGSIVIQETPLVVLPPFVLNLTSIDGRKDEWTQVEALVERLGFKDDALLFYRACMIQYLLIFQSSDSTTSNSIKQRLLALYDPSTQPSEQAKITSFRRSLSQALRSPTGTQAASELFGIIGRQLKALMDIQTPARNMNDEQFQWAIFQSAVFQEELISLAYIYNINNMDGLFVPPGADSSCTVIYDSISRVNHSCVSNCVHYLEDEQSSQGTMGGVDSIKHLTPQRLEQVRLFAASSTTNSSSSSDAANPPAQQPFLRTLRSLRPITPGEELTISYLSPQLLCQSTAQRNDVLSKQWGFQCRCQRCTSVDVARVLLCPKCQQGSIFIQPIFDSAPTGSSVSALEAPSFTFVSTCACVLPPAATSQLLADEQALIAAFQELRASVSSSPQPLALCTAFGVSLKLKSCLSDQHWLRYEYHSLMFDLYQYLNKRLDQMDAQKLSIWYLERVLQWKLATRDQLTQSQPKPFSSTYDQSSLLIDVTSTRFITPHERVSALYPCTELFDAYLTYADLCWQIHVNQTADLAALMIQRSIYFLLCGIEIEQLLHGRTSTKMIELQRTLAERSQIGQSKKVELSRILEPPPSSATSSTTSATHSSSSGSIPSSTVCPLHPTAASPAQLICSRCRGIRYCSRECQKAHWKQHKPNCKEG